MPSNALDAYGLMLSAIADPNPVLVLLPKALLRVRGDRQDPRRTGRRERTEGADRRSGRRSGAAGSRAGRSLANTSSRSASRPLRCARATTCTVVSYGRTLPLCVQAADELTASKRGSTSTCSTCGASSPTTGRRSAPSVPQNRPAADRQRGHRGDQLRRAPAAAGDRRAFLRSAGPAAAAGGQARPGHRAESGLRTEHGTAAARDQRRLWAVAAEAA